MVPSPKTNGRRPWRARMGGLYQIEDHIRGSSPDNRLAARQQYAVPLLKSLHAWMIESLATIEKK